MRRLAGVVLVVALAAGAFFTVTVLKPEWWERIRYPLEYKAIVRGHARHYDLDPVSEYDRSLSPAGGITSVQEQVALFRDAVQASFELAGMRATLTTAAGLAQAGLSGGGGASYHAILDCDVLDANTPNEPACGSVART